MFEGNKCDRKVFNGQCQIRGIARFYFVLERTDEQRQAEPKEQRD